MERDGDNILVISRYVLDAKAYNDEVNAEVTWETCSVRQWLNESFLLEAFNEKQQEMLLSTKVEAHANPFENVYTGKDTIDKVFLLSTYEVLDYYGGTIYDGGRNREILATEYAIAQGVSIEWKARTESGYLGEGETVKVKEGTCNWWLRTQGRDGKTAVFIFQDGKISCLGSLNYSRNVGVRPAIWISAGS